MEEDGLRWVVMEYDLRGGAVNTDLIYPEQLTPKGDLRARRKAALARYGGKSILYPR